MKTLLDTRHGLTCYATTAVEEVVDPLLLTMVATAWQADAQGHAHMRLEAPWLRRLTREPTWFAVIVRTDAGIPVGYALLWERVLYWHQQPLRAYALTFLTVAAQQRRRGLGRWMLQCLQRYGIEAQQAEVFVAAFHPARAGLVTVQHTAAQSPGWGLRVFQKAPLWGRPLDRAMCGAPEASVAPTRVVLPAGAATLLPGTAADGHPLLPSVDAIQQALSTQCHVAFGLKASMRTRYFYADTPYAGTWWYTSTSQANVSCGLSFEMVSVIDHQGCSGVVGILQAVYPQGDACSLLLQAVQHLCAYLQSHGCQFMLALDHQLIPHSVLYTLGFHPTNEVRLFAVWGPQALVEALPTVSPPCMLDW